MKVKDKNGFEFEKKKCEKRRGEQEIKETRISMNERKRRQENVIKKGE